MLDKEEAMVLICYSTGSREILGYISRVVGIAAVKSHEAIYPEYHSCPCYNIYIVPNIDQIASSM